MSDHETATSAEAESALATRSGKELYEALFSGVYSKDLAKVMSCFADDAVVYDPHYPQPRMVGKAAIEQGMAWSLNALVKPSFQVRHMWLDENSGVAEIDTHHVLQGGMELKFDQVFVFEFHNGKFTRIQAYVPYRPPGIGGLVGRLTGLIWRLQGRGK